VFSRCGEPSRSYQSKGKYQVGNNLAELKKNWKPSMMLPNLQKDIENENKETLKDDEDEYWNAVLDQD